MGLGSWILRNKAKLYPVPFMSVLMLPIVIAVNVLIALIVLFVFLFVKEVGERYLLLIFFLVAFFLIAYLMRSIYFKIIYSFKLWLIKRNGKNKFDKIMIRFLKYCILTYIYLPLLLTIIQISFLSQNSDLLLVTYPFIYFKYSLSVTLVVAIIVETCVSEKVFQEVDKIYHTPL